MRLSLFDQHSRTSPREPSALVCGLYFSLAPSFRLFAGDHGGAAIPVPIPNTEVKRSIAEGSAGPARARVGRRRLFSCLRAKRAGMKKAVDFVAPPLGRPSGSAAPRGIRLFFSFCITRRHEKSRRLRRTPQTSRFALCWCRGNFRHAHSAKLQNAD